MSSRQTTLIAGTVVATLSVSALVQYLLRQRSTSFIDRAHALLSAYLEPRAQEEPPVVRLASPDELEAIFDEAGCALTLGAGDAPASEDALLTACSLTLDYSTRSASLKFFNQLYGRADTASIVGDWFSTAINANVHTYEVEPVLTLMETHVIRRLGRAIGGAFAAACDGLFVPGGSIGNLYGMHLARHRAAPQVHTKGAAACPRLVAFTSADAHYSYLKSARLLGLGSDNLVSVPCDAHGGMCAAGLRKAVAAARAAGGLPFFVGATAGTTVTGAFDELGALAAVCAESSPPLYMHVDGAWGGATLFSPTHRGRLGACEEADSFSWSAHKMMGATLQCAAFVTRHADVLRAANATNAAYLFQPDKLFVELDAGDKTIQCGRKADMLKLWLMMKALGDGGMAARVDKCYALAAHAVARIEASGGAFRMAHPYDAHVAPNVCFWYVPSAMRPLGDAPLGRDHALHGVAPHIKSRMQQGGSALIGFQSIHGLPNFFRWVFASPDAVTTGLVDEVLGLIASLGEEYAPKPTGGAIPRVESLAWSTARERGGAQPAACTPQLGRALA